MTCLSAHRQKAANIFAAFFCAYFETVCIYRPAAKSVSCSLFASYLIIISIASFSADVSNISIIFFIFAYGTIVVGFTKIRLFALGSPRFLGEQKRLGG